MQWQSGAEERKSLGPRDWMSLITQLLLSYLSVFRGRYVPVWAMVSGQSQHLETTTRNLKRSLSNCRGTKRAFPLDLC